MPNWVYNALSASSTDPVVITEIRDLVRSTESEFSFNKIIPRPASKEKDWYDWNIANWGTKWDASEVSVTEKEDGSAVQYNFNTPWAPPVSVLQRLSRKFPKVEFELQFEEEQGWGGVMKLKRGKTKVTREWDIPETHVDVTARQGECHCEPDSPWYPDCRYETAKILAVKEPLVYTPEVLEFFKSLGQNWEGSFEELLSAAKSM
jgi:hypothetical protein